jgi:hypothetical protein
VSLLHSSLADSQKSVGLTDQAHLIHCSAKNIIIIIVIIIVVEISSYIWVKNYT